MTGETTEPAEEIDRGWRGRLSAVMQAVVRAAGSTTAVVVAVLVVVSYFVAGIFTGYTSMWFQILHAWTGLTAFLMVFLIQHAEDRDTRAIMLKLDELVAATSGARDRIIGVEQEDLETQERLEEEDPLE